MSTSQWSLRGADRELTDQFQRARALHEAGRTREAELAYRAVLAGRLERDERVHPDTLAAWQSLALLLSVDGRAEEAGAMAAAATESYARLFGVDHPDTLASRGNLGLVRYTQGQFVEAAALHTSVLAAHERTLGPGAPPTVEIRLYLARTLSRMGRAEEAEALVRRNVALASGPHKILEARALLADLLFQQDRLTEALAGFAAVATEAEVDLAPDDPVAILALQGNAAVLFGLGRFAEAETAYRRALAGCPADDPSRTLVLASLQHLRAARGDAEPAVVELRALLDECRRRWGPDAPVARCVPVMLGDVLLMADQPAAAVEVFDDVVTELTRTAGPHDGATLCARHMLGAALIRVGQTDEAEVEFRVAAAREDRPPAHSCALATRQGLARVAAARGDLVHAATEHAAVAAGLTSLYGDEHPNTLDARFDVADLLGRTGAKAGAAAAHRAVLAARTRVLGADHPDTRKSRAALR